MLNEYSIDADSKDGGYAWVHFAVRKADGEKVAIKFSRQSDSMSMQRFVQENKILKELSDNDGIVNVYSNVLKGLRNGTNRYYYVMERLQYSLEGWLNHAITSENDHKKIKIVEQIYKTLGSIHGGGYVHRDLHEGNVLLNINGDEVISKITDFGRSFDLNLHKKITKPNRPAWGELIVPPEILFGVIDIDDEDYINGDYYAAGMLVKTMFSAGIDAEALLTAIQSSIRTFQSKITGQLYIRYLLDRSFPERVLDYAQWCSEEAPLLERQFSVLLRDQALSDGISKLIGMSASLNYADRMTGSQELIDFIKGI